MIRLAIVIAFSLPAVVNGQWVSSQDMATFHTVMRETPQQSYRQNGVGASVMGSFRRHGGKLVDTDGAVVTSLNVSPVESYPVANTLPRHVQSFESASMFQPTIHQSSEPSMVYQSPSSFSQQYPIANAAAQVFSLPARILNQTGNWGGFSVQAPRSFNCTT